MFFLFMRISRSTSFSLISMSTFTWFSSFLSWPSTSCYLFLLTLTDLSFVFGFGFFHFWLRIFRVAVRWVWRMFLIVRLDLTRLFRTTFIGLFMVGSGSTSTLSFLRFFKFVVFDLLYNVGKNFFSLFFI